MKFKLKPDRMYEDYYWLYFKCGWWPFWREAGFMREEKIEGRMVSLLKNENRL